MGVCVAKPATRDGQSPTDQRKGAVGSDQLPLGELKRCPKPSEVDLLGSREGHVL